MSKLLAPVLVLVALVVGLVVIDPPPPPADFAYINRGDVNTLDLQRMSWMQDLRVARMIFEGLVANDVFTYGFEPVPAVAESWEIERYTEDVGGMPIPRERYTFHLREDARWSNGSPVQASDFAYAWMRGILPDIASDYAKMFTFIRGVDDFKQWRSEQTRQFTTRTRGMTDEEKARAARELWDQTQERFRTTVGIKTPDSRTFVVELAEPVPYFLDLCAFPPLFPVYEPLVRQYDELDPLTGRIQPREGWTKPPHIVCNGPMMLTRWRYLREMRFERNPYYWNPDVLGVNSISIPSVADPNAQVLAFERGEVGWVSDVTVGYRVEMLRKKRDFYDEHKDEYTRLKALGLDQFEIDRRLPPDPRKNIHAVPAFGTYWYNFNCLPRLPDGRPNPFHDARVRRAFAMMIDKRAICEDVQRIGNPIARTMIPAGAIGGYASPRGLDCISDATTPAERQAMIDRARALLAEAGYPDPRQLPEIQILFNKDAGHDLLAQVVQRNWQEYLGVRVSLVQKEVGVFRDDLKNANYMVSRAGWYGDYGDPTTFLDVNRTGDGNNDRKYSNPVFDDLLLQARRETDPVRRFEILAEAERILVEEDLPLVPIYVYVNVYLFNPDLVSGINPHPRSEQLMHLVDILGDGIGPDRPRVMRHSPDDNPFSDAKAGRP
ncbi:MAG: peptide ABC transporter substrate-binding protein [Phycisphaeraceae bacterium]|nr:peptide ABC transporter substrate-binding protein [Phycisphaeraceae bacterium]